MFKINLLPKEVMERRRYEGWYGRVFLVGGVLVAVVLAVYALFSFEVNSKMGELQSTQEQSKQYSQVAEQLSVFQSKEQELQQRQTVAQTALAGRVNVGQVANDISLVLPDEIWLDTLIVNQDTGVALTANTPRTTGQSADVAYKSVAKALVRLSELGELTDVWLSSATNSQWSSWATSSGGAKPVNVVAFSANSKVVQPGSGATSGSMSSSGVSAGQSATSAANSTNGSTVK